MRRKVLILHTGGTLGMRPREPDRALAPDEFGPALVEQVPELERIAEVHTRVLSNRDSSDLTPADWTDLATVIGEAIDDYAGFVVTHGTDAMAYTASALSYVLRDLPAPVILTGSQRPLVDVRSDARGNLITAVDLAQRNLPEVTIYFGGKLLRGNRATKSSSFAFGAFTSPNFPPLAEVGASVKVISEPLRPGGEFRVEGAFDPGVAVLRIVPGQRVEPLRGLLGTGVGAVLLQAFGVGNIPAEDSAVADVIRDLVDDGKVVAVCGQPPHGTVDLGTYPGGRAAERAGAVGTGDMTAEAASVKLMYLLGTYGSPGEVRDRLGRSLAGEITEE